jgi:hypothetical protein
MERMAHLEGQYLQAVQAALELEKARLPKEASRPQEPEEDEGRDRVLELLEGEWERVKAADRFLRDQGVCEGDQGPA